MTIKVEIPDEIARQVEARNMDVSAYVSELLESAAERLPLPLSTPLSDEELEAGLDRLAKLSYKNTDSAYRNVVARESVRRLRIDGQSPPNRQ